MLDQPTIKARLQIHFCVLLWGFTAILGKMISLPALPLVWWRMLLVVVALLFLPSVWRGLRALSLKLVLIYSGIGILVALHWLTFYHAIKLSNASVAATCIALAPAFTAMIEPIIAKRPFSSKELILGVIMLPGVALVVGGVPQGMHLGIQMGALSALLVAFFGSFNKRWVNHANPLTVTAIELGAGTLLLTLLAPIVVLNSSQVESSFLVIPNLKDASLLLILSLACTLLPFALSLMALRYLSAYSVQLVTNLEPVYAIILAIFLLNEQRELGVSFYVGVGIILAAVMIHPLLQRNFSLKNVEVTS